MWRARSDSPGASWPPSRAPTSPRLSTGSWRISSCPGALARAADRDGRREPGDLARDRQRVSILLATKPSAGLPGAGLTLPEFLRVAVQGQAAIQVETTGHSLGGALSPVLALWLADQQGTPAGWNPRGVATTGDRADGRLGHPARRQLFMWTDTRPNPRTYTGCILHSIAERLRWRQEYEAAKQAGQPVDNCSATGPP
jgi:hypothetical protein